MPDEIVDIVDENDNVLSQLGRKEAFEKNLRCRVVHSFLIDNVTKKFILLVRGKNVSFRPLHYSLAGGYAQTGETLDQAIQRELSEEFGIKPELTFLEKNPVSDPTNDKVFIDGLFLGFSDAKEITIDVRDVDRIELLDIQEIEDLLLNEPKLHPLLPKQIEVLRKHAASFSLK
jgi:ADP-ribose pyrophosphatase YjhB (NUDIX family)